jgi:hypothetical protein
LHPHIFGFRPSIPMRKSKQIAFDKHIVRKYIAAWTISHSQLKRAGNSKTETISSLENFEVVCLIRHT